MKKLFLLICTLSLGTVVSSMDAGEKREARDKSKKKEQKEKIKKHLGLTKEIDKKKTKAALLKDLEQAQRTIAQLEQARERTDELYQDEVRLANQVAVQTEEERDDYKQQLEFTRIEKSTLVTQRDFKISQLEAQYQALEEHTSYAQSTLLESLNSHNVTIRYQDEKLKKKRETIAQQNALIAKLRKELAEAKRSQAITRSPSWRSMYA